MKPIPISFTIDNLGDAADLQRGVIHSPRMAGNNPALEQGYPALLDLCGRYDIPLTCFVEGWSARQYPAFLQRLQALGHETGMHGWQHEHWAALAEPELKALAIQATAALTAALGHPPRTFRAPGGYSSSYTRRVLAELGYDIDASHGEQQDDDTEAPGAAPTVARIPYRWAGVDATHWLWNKLADSAVETLWQRELLAAAAGHYPFVFIWHPHVMGTSASRLAVGERIIRFIRSDPRFAIVPLRALRAVIHP